MRRCLARFCALLAGLFFVHPAAAHVVELPKLLQNGAPIENLTSDPGEDLVFRLVVPEGVTNLVFDTAHGTGNVDLFVRFGAHPDHGKFDDSSEGGTNREHVGVRLPRAGVWYVRLHAARPFRGVQLAASYQRTASAEAVPRVLPGPGVYAGRARVQLKTPLPGGLVRYTTDGTDPIATSPVYALPLKFTADTELRAQSFRGKTPHGPVLVAPFHIIPKGTVTELANGIALQHRAGLIASETLYKIDVPAGQERLYLLTRGGIGDVVLFLNYGAPPTHTIFRERVVAVRNRADLTIIDPEPGEWFVMLRGRGHYSGLTVQASFRDHRADLVVWPNSLQPNISTETFVETDCEVQEGMITTGEHRLLRFTTETRNVGGGDMRVGAPEGNPQFEFAACHGHYHFLGFASYVLRNAEGAPIATGRKVSFCLEDVLRWDTSAPRFHRYNCSDQGIQAGWSDIYDSGLPGQWVDITGVPPGAYQLEVTINPERFLEEADYSNNTATIPVTID